MLRASWLDPRVRFLWALAVLLAASAGWLTALQFRERQADNALITSGTKAEATVWSQAGPRRPDQPLRAGPVVLEFDYQGKPQEVVRELTNPPADLKAGGKVPIRYDPANPQHLTDRTEPQPIIRYLGAVLLLGPAMVICLAGAWLVRRRLLRLWREGIAQAAVVVDIHHSALAPLRRLVRCTLRDQRGGRLLSVYLPGGGTLRRDDIIWVITPPGRHDRAIAADMFAPLAGGGTRA